MAIVKKILKKGIDKGLNGAVERRVWVLTYAQKRFLSGVIPIFPAGARV